MTDTAPVAPLREVHILAMPLDVYREASEHRDELMREFALIRESDQEVPRRLLELVERLGNEFRGFTDSQEQQIQAALERGDPAIDLVYRVPPEVKAATQELARLLDEADEFCRRGTQLLTLATPGRALAFRTWFLDEFARQIDGQPPSPWPGDASSW